MKRWETARYMAMLAHAGQTDKAGKPYIRHLRAVADQCKGDAKIVAWLHDVVEDTEVCWIDMAHMITHFFGENDRSSEIDQAVQAITKLKKESYEHYLARVKRNPMAREVKIADLKHNLDLSRLPEIAEKDLERAAKYRSARLVFYGADCWCCATGGGLGVWGFCCRRQCGDYTADGDSCGDGLGDDDG